MVFYRSRGDNLAKLRPTVWSATVFKAVKYTELCKESMKAIEGVEEVFTFKPDFTPRMRSTVTKGKQSFFLILIP